MTTIDSQLQRIFYLSGSLMLIGGILYWGRPILIPIAIAVLVTFILSPIVVRLERWGLSRFVACVVTVLAAAIFVIGLIQLLALQIGSLTEEIPTYRDHVSRKIDHLRQWSAETWIGDYVDKQIASVEVPILPVIQAVAATTLEILINAVLVFVLALLMLMRREDFRNRLIHLLGTDRLVSTTRLLDDASRRLSRFLLSQLILNVGFGIVVAIGLYVIGIPYAYVWGAIGAMLRYVPFLGGWLAPLFPLLASLVLPSWTPFFLTAIFFVVLELLQAYLIEPLVFGHSIGISSAGQLIAALFWVCLWGPMGLILSTPLTAWICVLGRHFPVLRMFSELMGENEVVEKSTAFYQRLLAEDTSEAVDLVEEFIQDHSSAEACDALFMPALLAAQNDEHVGELAKDHQLSIAATMREIFEDVVVRAAACEMHKSDETQSTMLRVEFPFNGDTDRFIAEMLATTSSPAVKWATADAKDVNSNVMTLTDDHQASVIFLATAAKKHLARVRGACKKLRDLFPQAQIVVGAWGLEDRVEYTRARLKASGATAVCTTLSEARQIVERELPAYEEKSAEAPAASVAQEIGAGAGNDF